MKGEMERPDWLSKDLTGYEETQYEVSLYLVPKDPKFEGLAQKLLAFLNSSESVEGYY